MEDHIFTMKQVIKKGLITKSKVYIEFINLEKAFNRVQHHKMWKSLERRGVDMKLVRDIKSLYKRNIKYIVSRNMRSVEFETWDGLRQGVMRLTLFTVFVDDIIKESTLRQRKMHLRYKNFKLVLIQECAFPDDVAIMAWKEELVNILLKWNQTLTKQE